MNKKKLQMKRYFLNKCLKYISFTLLFATDGVIVVKLKHKLARKKGQIKCDKYETALLLLFVIELS